MMRFHRFTMAGEIFIMEAPENLDHQGLLQKLDLEGCGAVVSFLGITRGHDNGCLLYTSDAADE